MQMVPRTYVTITIDDSIRADHVRQIAKAEARGDGEWAQLLKGRLRAAGAGTRIGT